MQRNPLTAGILVAGLVLSASSQAADVRINGFMSVVGGATLSEGTARNRATGAETPATFEADAPTGGVYDDDISFKPDTNYGVQISSNLGDGLSVTGQITGAGGEDFDANVSWAYVNYDLNDTWTVQAGRQRLPLFFYSDFLDVAYAYHWARTPQVLPAAFSDTFEGIKFAWSDSTDNWDWRASIYGGSGSAESGVVGIKTNNVLGGVIKVSNDWLQLRASYSQNELVISGSPEITASFRRNGVPQATSENPLGFQFAGVGVHMTFDDVFVVSEYALSAIENPFAPDFDAVGTDGTIGWYISSGIRIGNLTPHITYGYNEQTLSREMPGLTNDAANAASTITLGVRWDFHPSAAFKAEYSSRDDDSDDIVQNDIGFASVGNGDQHKVDIFTLGIDIIF